MAHIIKVTGTNSEFDGEWEFELAQPFTVPEWRIIKKVAGYLPNTWLDGLEGDDPDLWEALAMIALVRARRVDARQVLLVQDMLDAGRCVLLADPNAKADDVSPPDGPQPSSPESGGPPSSPTGSSGNASPSGSETERPHQESPPAPSSETSPSGTGEPGSEPSST